jgi:small neutral amino acid transporter SnatA (MarC family)
MQLNEFIGVTALFFSLANPVGVIPIFLKLVETHKSVHPARIIAIASATVGLFF